MTRTLLIDAIGTVIGIDGSALTEDAWAAVKTAWQDAIVRTTDHAVPAMTIVAHGTVPRESMLASLSIDVTLAALRDRAGSALLLHAAGLAAPDGRVIALVGASGRGKTTASRVLGRVFGYVSDESVGIAVDGTVLPYRKPLSLIEEERPLKVQRSPHELRLMPLPDTPLKLAGLVLLERDEEHVTPRLEHVDPAEAIVGLAEQASYLGRMRRPLATMVAHLEAVGGVHRLRYRDVETLASLIRQLFEASSVSPGYPVDMVPHDAEPLLPSTRGEMRLFVEPGSPGGYRRVSVLDSFTLDDDRLVLLARLGEHSTRVFVLAGIAPTIWNVTASPVTLDELVAATIAVHGDPAGIDAANAVAAIVAELVNAELLTLQEPE